LCGARRLQAAARTVSEAVNSAGVFATPKAAAYWGYHLSRSGFFLLQGLAGAPHPMPYLTGVRLPELHRRRVPVSPAQAARASVPAAPHAVMCMLL